MISEVAHFPAKFFLPAKTVPHKPSPPLLSIEQEISKLSRERRASLFLEEKP